MDRLRPGQNFSFKYFRKFLLIFQLVFLKRAYLTLKKLVLVEEALGNTHEFSRIF